MITLPITSFTGDYRWLSNFFIEPDWTCVEWEYQQAKCGNAACRRRFSGLESQPGKAKALGRRVPLRPDWEDVKIQIMLFYVERKFRQHSKLGALLKATGDAQLIEGNTWGDTYWGVCRGRGANMLGAILMDVRERLR